MTHNFPQICRMRRGCDINCHWCGTYISKGETYWTWGQAHEGYMNRLNMHPDCYHGGWRLWTEYEYDPGMMTAGQPEYDEHA